MCVCSICLRTLSEGESCTVNCGHMFHVACIKQAISFQPRCPVCRNDFPGNRIFVQRVFPCGERENRDISYVNRRSHSNCESTNKLKTRLKAEESKNKILERKLKAALKKNDSLVTYMKEYMTDKSAPASNKSIVIRQQPPRKCKF